MKMPINCCCDPTRLLGFVEVPRGEDLKPEDLISFLTCEGPLQLPMGNLSGLASSHPAIKSMDTPMEVLESIPGFEKFHAPTTDSRSADYCKAREQATKAALGEHYHEGPEHMMMLIELTPLLRELVK